MVSVMVIVIANTNAKVIIIVIVTQWIECCTYMMTFVVNSVF